jgi:acyl-coenzyme A synthetase/AMP-(fatty) acid ligase
MTGDMGSQDEEGNLYLTDQLKHLIKSKGFQIPLAKMESVLHEHPLVHDVVVLGALVQKIASQVPAAYVVLNEGTEGKQQVAEELVGYVATEISPHSRLSGGIIWIDGIPKGPS